VWRTLLALAPLAIAPASLAQDALAGELLTPEKAVEYALQANLDYLNLIDRTELAELDFASARSVYKKKFRLYTSSDARSGAEVGNIASFSVSKRNESGSAFQAELYNSSFGFRSLSEFRLSYTLPFFHNPLDSAKLRIEDAEMSLARRQRLQEIGTQELIDRVINSYLELILLNNLEDLAASEYEISNNRYQAYLIRSQGGEVSDLDLAQVELRMTQARQRLGLASFNRRSTETGFKRLLGIGLTESVRIDTRIPEDRNAELYELSLQALEEHAVSERIELIGQLDEMSLLQTKMAASSDSVLPPAEVTLQYAFVDESNSLGLPSDTEDHRFGIGLRMDTDFGAAAKSREQRRNYLRYRMMQRGFEKLQLDVLMEVRRAYFDVQQSRELLALRTRAREINEQMYNQVKIQFENGQTDTLALLEAEQSRAQSRHDELNARIAYLKAGQALAMASGHY
jgi:outer membrane protein TolC